MEIIFNSGGITSHVQKSTRIFSNDSVDSVTTVWISVDGIPNTDSSFLIQVSPNILDFTTVDLNESPEMEVKIRNITTTKLGIKIVDMNSELVKAKLSDKMIKPSGEVKLKVKLRKEAQEISLATSITIELDDENRSRLSIPIKIKQ